MSFLSRALLPLALLTAGVLEGCPSTGTPICPDCRMLAGGDCGIYTLKFRVEVEGGKVGPITDPVLAISYMKDGTSLTATKPLGADYSPLEIDHDYSVPISKVDFPALCEGGVSLWETATAKLKAKEGSNDVVFDVTIDY